MHGVGSQWVKMAFFVFGHSPFIPVLSQIEPDPEFPTVSFPNPEENGVRGNLYNILIYFYFLRSSYECKLCG